jgi:organic hydroperoxide reductase OsmC/OhrA
MASEHRYPVTVSWEPGEKGPTIDYASYSREWTAEREGKPELVGSADPHYKGNPLAWNPEDLLVASLSACHLLTYLALAAAKKLVVHSYEDAAEGLMKIEEGRMRVTDVTLRPKIGLAAGSDLALARSLHGPAHDQCFIANSVTVRIAVEPEFFEV